MQKETSIDGIPYTCICTWRYTEFFRAVNIDQCNLQRSLTMKRRKMPEIRIRPSLLVAWLIWPERKVRTKDCNMVGSLSLSIETKRALYYAYWKSICTLACCHIAYAFVWFHECCMYCMILILSVKHDLRASHMTDVIYRQYLLQKRLINHFTTQITSVSLIIRNFLKFPPQFYKLTSIF